MILAQISDTHITCDHPQAAARADDLRCCIADINRLDPQPDAVIHTGDLTHRGRPEEFEAAGEILRDLRAPFYPAAGNRDTRAGMAAALQRFALAPSAGGFVQYAVDPPPLRLIAVDTLSEASNKGEFCQARAADLAGLLERDRSRPTIVFLHHPPFDVEAAADPFQFETRRGAERLGQTLAPFGQVIGAFCGHAHRTASGMIGPVTASVMPSVASGLRMGELAGEAPVYQLHRVNGDGRINTETRVLDAVS